MEKNKDWRPRLSIDLSEEKYKKLQDLIPWGLKSQIFNHLIDDLISMIESGGEMFLATILARRMKLGDFLRAESDRGDLIKDLTELLYDYHLEDGKSSSPLTEIDTASDDLFQKRAMKILEVINE